MARPSTPADRSKLPKRIASALALLAIAAGAVWAGGWMMALFLITLAALLYWEWIRLTSLAEGVTCVAVSIVFGILPVVTAWFWPQFEMALLALVFLVSLVIAIRRFGAAGFWLALGPPLFAATMIAAIHLRVLPGIGLETVLWAVLIVSAMDIGGYAFGKTIGGPKMVPGISPGKTWAGLLGGMGLASLFSLLAGQVLGGGGAVSLLMLGAGLALAAQGGDLLESVWKRHFGVKDSSGLLPGHGGFLDRLDGYLTVLPIVALMAALSGGSPLLWP